MLAPAGPKLH